MSSIDTVILKFINGDVEAMNTLIEIYQSGLYSLCYRLTSNNYDADDLFQQTWIKVMNNSSKYKNVGFKAWIYRICINQYKDNYRKQRLKNKHIVSAFTDDSAKVYIMDAAQPALSAEREYEKLSDKQVLIGMINRLPAKQRLPIILHYFQSLKYSEVAQVLGIAEGTVKSRVSTAKKNLKSLLENE